MVLIDGDPLSDVRKAKQLVDIPAIGTGRRHAGRVDAQNLRMYEYAHGHLYDVKPLIITVRYHWT